MSCFNCDHCHWQISVVIKNRDSEEFTLEGFTAADPGFFQKEVKLQGLGDASSPFAGVGI